MGYGEQINSHGEEKTPSGDPEKASSTAAEHLKEAGPEDQNLVYDVVDEEPEIHARTYVAIAAMFLLNLVQVFALQGPPSVLSYIGTSLHNTQAQTWVPNSLSLVQAVICPLISSASDTFQARKALLVGTSLISFIGAAIAPGSQSIYRLIVAQILIGFGFASVPLAYCVPSEILPRRWRPMAQACMNIAAATGAITAPLIIGALTERNVIKGWRDFYWIQMALWGMTALGLFFGYRPPKRHTRLDHLSFWQKLSHLDLPGFSLLTSGLTLFLTGLNLGGGLYTWSNARPVALIAVGLTIMAAFFIYEWKGTKTGILHHELFQGGKNAGRTFAICISLIFIEGILLFSYIIFYPVMTTNLFQTDPFKVTVRDTPFWIATLLTTTIWGYASTRFRTIRLPLFFGFLLYTAGIAGLASVKPGQSAHQLVFAGLAGAGFGAPLILIISGVQLATPHHLIATATAVTTSSRAVAATVFTAIYSATFSTQVGKNLPTGVAKAAIQAGLPPSKVPALLQALTGPDPSSAAKVPGVDPAIIVASLAAVKDAFAVSLRDVYLIAVPFGIVACIACLFLGDMRKTMNYRVDAPVEDLHAKHHRTPSHKASTAAENA